MTKNTKIHLPYGCNRGLPDNVTVAWGARMIAPSDLVWDRQGCDGGVEGGPERSKLLDWLNSGAGPAQQRFCSEHRIGKSGSVIADNASEEVITLYEDSKGKVVGSPQGSYGYVYVAAWLFEHVDG